MQKWNWPHSRGGDWYNNRRLLGRLGHTPPAEAQKAHYASIGNNDLAT
ncbi:putative integrase core domain-containing protein [Escherichia coli 2-011-08_S1_C1]|nr:putative integrase core domain-containing protein [Escherichia coli 2-011-08_S1_C1]